MTQVVSNNIKKIVTENYGKKGKADVALTKAVDKLQTKVILSLLAHGRENVNQGKYIYILYIFSKAHSKDALKIV